MNCLKCYYPMIEEENGAMYCSNVECPTKFNCDCNICTKMNKFLKNAVKDSVLTLEQSQLLMEYYLKQDNGNQPS